MSLIVGQQSTVQIKVGIIEIPPALLTCFLAHHRLKARLLKKKEVVPSGQKVEAKNVQKTITNFR